MKAPRVKLKEPHTCARGCSWKASGDRVSANLLSRNLSLSLSTSSLSLSVKKTTSFFLVFSHFFLIRARFYKPAFDPTRPGFRHVCRHCYCCCSCSPYLIFSLFQNQHQKGTCFSLLLHKIYCVYELILILDFELKFL